MESIPAQLRSQQASVAQEVDKKTGRAHTVRTGCALTWTVLATEGCQRVITAVSCRLPAVRLSSLGWIAIRGSTWRLQSAKRKRCSSAASQPDPEPHLHPWHAPTKAQFVARDLMAVLALPYIHRSCMQVMCTIWTTLYGDAMQPSCMAPSVTCGEHSASSALLCKPYICHRMLLWFPAITC
jgi:hypothetical protein